MEDIATVRATTSSGLDQDVHSEVVIWPKSGYILKVEPRALTIDLMYNVKKLVNFKVLLKQLEH